MNDFSEKGADRGFLPGLSSSSSMSKTSPDSYSNSHKAEAKVAKYNLKKFNVEFEKKNENDAVKKVKIKIKFQKMMGTFMDSILWLKSPCPPLKQIHSKYLYFLKFFQTFIYTNTNLSRWLYYYIRNVWINLRKYKYFECFSIFVVWGSCNKTAKRRDWWINITLINIYFLVINLYN